ncbi:MAG TPA: hypothetical protein VM778_07010 [Gemmatimonadota bacterium]|nr:hypothetical protein [Gemmatimonadota bacterium]
MRTSRNFALATATLLLACAGSACSGSGPMDLASAAADSPGTVDTRDGSRGTGGDDNSGPGNGGEDNSGRGTGGDDNSGPGSGGRDDDRPDDDEIHGFVGSVDLAGRTFTTTGGLRVRVATDDLIEADGDIRTLSGVADAVGRGVEVRVEADGTPGPDEFVASSVKFEVDD